MLDHGKTLRSETVNLHYDNYLTRKYPLLYRDRHSSMQTTAMFWGFSCGDGWFNIINTLSQVLSEPYLSAKREYECGLERGTLVPEELERRRLKMELLKENHPVAMQVKEKFGGLRFYADNVTPEMDYYIRFAEAQASNTCEVCGDRGSSHGGGWIRTLCGKHEQERLQNANR
jgi:hypothetical protein